MPGDASGGPPAARCSASRPWRLAAQRGRVNTCVVYPRPPRRQIVPSQDCVCMGPLTPSLCLSLTDGRHALVPDSQLGQLAQPLHAECLRRPSLRPRRPREHYLACLPACLPSLRTNLSTRELLAGLPVAALLSLRFAAVYLAMCALTVTAAACGPVVRARRRQPTRDEQDNR